MIDIIIVNYNSTDYLLKCLRSIFDDLGGRLVNVFVQDNGSRDGIDRIPRHFPQVRVHENKKNIGYSKAINQTLKESSSPFIVLLNPDTRIEKGFFDAVLEYINTHPEIGVIGPKILNPDGSVQGSARSFPTPLTSIFGRKSPITKLFPNNRITTSNILTSKSNGKTPMTVDWVSGACMVIRRKAIQESGLLDERFFMYWEDADWCRQIREKGWKVVYFPSASVFHIVGISSSTRPIRSIYHFHKSCYLLYDKYIHWPLSISKPVAFIGLALRFYVASFFHLVNLKIYRHHKLPSTAKRETRRQTTQKIKMLRIITRLNIGGPAIHVQLLTQGLDKKRFESTLVTGKISPQEGDMTYLSEGHSKKPIIIKELQRKIDLGKDLKAIAKILRIIYQEKPDIVHTHMAKAGFCARIAGFLYNLFSRHKIKTIHTFHGHVFEGYFKKPVSRAFIWIERLLSKFTDVIIAISNTQKHELSDKYRITPARKIKTIKLGFQLKSFLESNRCEHPFRQRLGIDDNTLLIGIVGRLVPIKNHVMFLNGVKIFLEQNPDVHAKFIVVGDGELRSVLEEYCQEQGLSDHVRFCGWVIDVHSVYADLDVLALTSLNEGTPVSVIEAMASSVPVIASDVGGIRDLLGPSDGLSTENGFQTCERGLLCRKNDAESFAHGLQHLMKNGSDENRRRTKRAKDFVVRHYSQKRLLNDMEHLYNNLLYESGERRFP